MADKTKNLCRTKGCNNLRHITITGRLRTYCRECENEASKRSKAKTKIEKE